MEIWKDIPTLEGRYQVSDQGRVRSIKNSTYTYLKSNAKSGSKEVSFVINNKITVFEIRHLMAYAFLGCDINASTKPKLLHKDGNVHNIVLSNLQVADYSDLNGEIWKDITCFPEYQISNLGRVKRKLHTDVYIRKDTGVKCYRNVGEKILKPIENQGYLEINLQVLGKSKYIFIHRLVCEAFVPNPYHKPQINHIDGNKHNNRWDNLEWVTCKENILHASKLGLRKNPSKGVARKPVKLRCFQTGQIFNSIKEAAEKLDLKYNYLYSCIYENKPCHEYTFERLN